MMKRIASVVAVAALAVAGLFGASASADTAAGTWAQSPEGAATYQAAIQQPINTMNTSNWSRKSKGGIPVQFKLQSGTGPAVFESIGSDPGTGNDYAFMSFTPSSPLLFSDLTDLSASYAFTQGDHNGGSLRWSIRTDPTHAVFIYYGDYPNFTTGGNSQSGTNMIGLGDLRYDTSQYVNGTFYDSYAHALTLVGNQPVTRASLVLDGGWANDQRLAAGTTATVNGNAYTWNSGGSGELTDTCDLPTAKIEVNKTDPVEDGPINEAPVQGSLTDDGNTFRVVDCKYQYILSIPSLSGAGTYRVWITIGGDPVPTPDSADDKVKFDLK
jgi:hypothetical protein